MNFEEYYKQYLSLHTKWSTRYLHLIGNISTLFFLLFVLISDISLFWLILTPFIVYPFAWSGHFFFEKNKPAAFSSPFYAKLSDWRMMWDLITRRIT